MEDLELMASVLKPLDQNQLALGAPIGELSNWIEHRGSGVVAENVRGALEKLDENHGLITLALISLSADSKSGDI